MGFESYLALKLMIGSDLTEQSLRVNLNHLLHVVEVFFVEEPLLIGDAALKHFIVFIPSRAFPLK